MTHQHPTHPDLPRDPDDLSPAALLRAAADDELSASQTASFEALCARDDSARLRVEHDRALRQGLSRLQSAQRAPEALRARVGQILRDSAIDAPAGDPLPFRQPATAARSWQRPWWMGMAAGFILAAGVLMLVAPWKNTVAPSPAGPVAIESGPYSTTHLVNFLTDQHNSCANFGTFFKRKMVYRSRPEAERAAVALLSKVPDVFELAGGALTDMGYSFAGLGQCQVPGRGKSAHLIYTSEQADNPPISLWIQQDTGEWNSRIKDLGCSYSVTLCEERGTGLSIWRNDGLVYFLYTPTNDLQKPARHAFGAPTREDSI